MFRISDIKVGDIVRYTINYYLNDGNVGEVVEVKPNLGVGGAVKVAYRKHDSDKPEAFWEWANKDGFIGAIAKS